MIYLSVPLFSHLQNGNNNILHQDEGLNEITNIKGLSGCQAHDKCYINVSRLQIIHPFI